MIIITITVLSSYIIDIKKSQYTHGFSLIIKSFRHKTFGYIS